MNQYRLSFKEHRAACFSRVPLFGTKQRATSYIPERKRGRDSNTGLKNAATNAATCLFRGRSLSRAFRNPRLARATDGLENTTAWSNGSRRFQTTWFMGGVAGSAEAFIASLKEVMADPRGAPG